MSTNLQTTCEECHGVNGHRDPFCSLLDLSGALADDDEESTPIDKAEVEERLEKLGLDGLVNLYRAITGKECERYVALGMATIAVSRLKAERDNLKEEVERLTKHAADLNHDLQSTIDHCDANHVDRRA